MDFKKVAKEFKRIITELCDRPGHREQWAILLAGVAIYPLIGLMIAILVWFGTHAAVNAALVVPILGNFGYGFLGLFGLVVVALLGIIRKVSATLPGGAQLSVEIDDDDDEHPEENSDESPKPQVD